MFAPSVSPTLSVSVFSACFWPEWRPNNCWRGNVRASGTFIRLFCNEAVCTNLGSRPLSGVHIAISRNSLGGEVSAGSTICQSSPLLPCSFPDSLPQIDPSTRDLNYIFSLSLLSLPISSWILTLRWQFGANPTEFEQNAKFRPIPGHNGQVGV